MKIVSLFSGAGGLDRGFENAGFHVAWSNEFDKTVWPTYRANFPHAHLNTSDLATVRGKDIAREVGGDIVGVIGGPPCQSWSEAGTGRGLNEQRGQMFLEYIRIVRDIRPAFFVAENVSGLLFRRHDQAVRRILTRFRRLGYIVAPPQVINAKSFGVPQDRERVVLVGYHRDHFSEAFGLPSPDGPIRTLRDSIGDLQDIEPLPVVHNKTRKYECQIANHEYMVGTFSPIFLSRQRVRGWDEPSFTIQASGRHVPIHPSAPKMEFVEKDSFKFAPGYEADYRRLSVREVARIQTFADDFVFEYDRISDGYKMIGNAVPVLLAERIAAKIRSDLTELLSDRSFAA